MEKSPTQPEKTFSFARRGLSVELDNLGSSPGKSPPYKPSPRPNNLPSPRPSSLPSPQPKKYVDKDGETHPDKAEEMSKTEDPPDPLSGFGKIFEDVDNFILALSYTQQQRDGHDDQNTDEPADPKDSNYESAEKVERDPEEKDEKTEEAKSSGKAGEKDESNPTEETENSHVKNDDDESKREETSEEEAVPECVAKFLDLVEGIVIGRDVSRDGGCRWNEVPEGDMLLLESIDRISKMVTVLEGSKTSSKHPKLFNRAGKIQHRAMSFLEEQLRSLIEDTAGQSNLDGGDEKEENQPEEGETDPDLEPYPNYPNDVVSSIKSIAARMLSAGYEAECCNVYMIARQNALDDSVYKVMGFERISIDDVQKLSWEALEKDISTWIRTCEKCATVYFPGELRLMKEIFADHPTIMSCLYRNLLRTVLIHLLNFAEAVAMLKRSTEKLFKVLDMYETMRDTILSTESLFPDEYTSDLKSEATTARSRLGEAAICIFCELENSIRSETGKTQVPGGAVHPLTRYTMNYLNYACHYKKTLEQVFKEHSKIERADSTSRQRHEDTDSSPYENSNDVDENQSPFSVEIVKVMDMLDANLETKSKLYKDIALSSIFMMNNGRYIMQKIKNSPEIHELMGDTWSRRRSTNLRNYHRVYQRDTWNKLLGFLAHEGVMNGGKVVKPVLKERFKSFNTLFDEIHKTQSTWVVSDEQLQSELRISISSLVIPAYRSFLGRFSQYLDPGRQYEKYVKFQAEDIETCIDELFDGNVKKK